MAASHRDVYSACTAASELACGCCRWGGQRASQHPTKLDIGRARTVYEIRGASILSASCTFTSSGPTTSRTRLPTVPSWLETMVGPAALNEGGRMMPKAHRTWELNPKFGASALGAGPARGGRAYGDCLEAGRTALGVARFHGVTAGMTMISRHTFSTEPNPQS